MSGLWRWPCNTNSFCSDSTEEYQASGEEKMPRVETSWWNCFRISFSNKDIISILAYKHSVVVIVGILKRLLHDTQILTHNEKKRPPLILFLTPDSDPLLKVFF